MSKQYPFDDIIYAEDWKIENKLGKRIVIIGNKEFTYNHPFAIHAKLYRESKNSEEKYLHIKAMHDYAWPHLIPTWNYWDERRLQAHCNGHNYITYAGGASTGKSHMAARIAILFWLAAPNKRTVIVASTTLESATTRIWGYITRLLSELAIQYPYRYFRGNCPKVLYDKNDPIHGMYAVAAGRGTDEQTISNWIGKHPKEAIMVVLDEATDLNPAILKSLPNLEAGGVEFSCIAIGNSASKFDLHGALSTPLATWNSVDPYKDNKWDTTQKNGICLFFSCYESPAIHEGDPIKKALLERFFVTQEQIEEKEKLYGKESDSFWRMVIGFWKLDSTEETVISKLFIDDFRVFEKAEWAGVDKLKVIAGLDPAFSTGGDQCILRLAILGQDVTGKIILDFRGNELLFKIPITAHSKDSADIQIAKKVISILKDYGVRLADLAIDANGQGRALGEVIRLQAGALDVPIKIYCTKSGQLAVKSFDVTIKNPYELWFCFRDFIQNKQIRGLDNITIYQLTTRQVHYKNGKASLEQKKDYKNRMGAIMPSLARSPDEADAAALCLQVAIINYGFHAGQMVRKKEDKAFEYDKFSTYQALLKPERETKAVSRMGGIEASFTGDLADIKFPFS